MSRPILIAAFDHARGLLMHFPECSPSHPFQMKLIGEHWKTAKNINIIAYTTVTPIVAQIALLIFF
jgi:hypothetical protein